MNKRLFLVAAEPSGDLLGRELVETIRRIDSRIEICGIGGEALEAVGIRSDIDIRPLSVLGFLEGLAAYPKVIELADAATDEIVSKKPDAVILIDSWGFMLRVAQRLRKRAPDLHLIKLIGPQVWATRSGRAKTLAGTVDHLLTMFDMEVAYYTPYGLKTTVIGNPALGRSKQGNGEHFRAKHNITTNGNVLLLLPGSRPGEIKRVAPTLVDAVRIIKSELPELTVVMSPASSVYEQFIQAFPDVHTFAVISNDASDRFDAMAAANLAIACSGTVTTELAMQGTPYLVGYKLGWITWAIARGFLYKPEYMTLLNISAGQEIAPEYLQTTFKAEAIAQKAVYLLRHPEQLLQQARAQTEAVKKMGADRRPAAEVAAEAILSDLMMR